jgi:glycerol uptake facilitator-like aquaporin
MLYEFLGTAIMIYAYNCVPTIRGSDTFLTLNVFSAVKARPLAYLMMWIISYKVSGAHFNPATSFAVFIAERRMKNLPGFLLTFFAQVCGAYLGVALSYLLIKDYMNESYLMPPRTVEKLEIYESLTGDINWGRLVL